LDYRKLLVQHLDQIERIVRLVARRRRLSAFDADEFAGVVRFKLVADDFAILRKFQGRSALTTYLTVVIDRLCLDFCVAKWGKWRPSASARRLGAVATLLEQLIVREGITFDEAVGTLQTNHGVTETREQLHDILLQLPTRTSRHPAYEPFDAVDPNGVTNPGAHHPDDYLIVERVQAALATALTELTDDDRQIVTLHYDVGLPLVQVARALDLEARRLSRRLDDIIERLRAAMLRQGVDADDIARVITHPALSMMSLLVDARRTTP
jgi:RNA polymerase sigma factor (sigma-70 family)